MEQLVARRAHNPKATGSSPVPATKQSLANNVCQAFFYYCATFLIRYPEAFYCEL